MKKYIKFLILSMCCCSIPQAAKCAECMNDKIDTAKLIQESKYFSSGSSAVLYTHKNYPGKVIKRYNGVKIMSGHGTEDEIASKFNGDDVPMSLMKCCKVLDENTIIYDRIDGISLKDWLFNNQDNAKIPFDVFCRDWVISMFEGMRYFYNKVIFPEKMEKKGKILYRNNNEPHLPCDMTDINIMIRRPNNDSMYPTPVKIDYGSLTWGASDVLMRLANMFSYVMKYRVEYNEGQKSKFDELYKFLNFSDDYRTKSDYNIDDAEEFWFNPNLLIEELKKIIG